MPPIPTFSKLKSLIEKIGGDGNKVIDYHPDNSKRELHLHINLSQNGTSEQITPQLTEAIKSAIQSTPFQLSSESTEQSLKKIEEFSSQDKSDLPFQFVNSRIPPEDKYLWLSALMLRKASQRGSREQVRTIKDQMVSQSGQKGRNIANICNSGYLEEYIIPWYKHYVEEEDDRESFYENYKLIVEQLLFVVFVSGSSSIEVIKAEVEFKVQSVLNAHMDKLFIHALGDTNIAKAETVINEIRAECKEVKDVKKETTRATLKAEILLQRSTAVQ